MPSGVTADLYEGKDTSLRGYLMGVARGMGYAIMQRDDDPDAPVAEVAGLRTALQTVTPCDACSRSTLDSVYTDDAVVCRRCAVGQTFTDAMAAGLPESGPERDVLVERMVRASLGVPSDFDDVREKTRARLLEGAGKSYDVLRSALNAKAALAAAPATTPEPVPSEVLACERMHEWLYAGDDDRYIVLDLDGPIRNVRARFVADEGGGEADDAILANAVLAAELVDDAPVVRDLRTSAPASPEPKGGGEHA